MGKVTRADLILLFGVGRDAGLSAGTINREVMVGLLALRNAGATITMKKGDWLKVTEIDAAIYEPEEIMALFAKCDADESLIFQTYLQSGFRNREVITLRWRDVDFAHDYRGSSRTRHGSTRCHRRRLAHRAAAFR